MYWESIYYTIFFKKGFIYRCGGLCQSLINQSFFNCHIVAKNFTLLSYVQYKILIKKKPTITVGLKNLYGIKRRRYAYS